jgi:hypothetical protein
MSIRVMTQVWDHGPDNQGELLVLLALADFADDRGVCWPSMASIARKARLTERGAQKIVRRLEATGHVRIVTGGGRHGCNQYVITPNVVRPEHSSPPNVKTSKPRTAVQETPNSGSPEPSRTIIREPSYTSAGDFDAFWAEVPRKEGKGAARKAYASALKKADHATLMAAIRRHAEERRGQDPKYTPHPATWLNAERWTDEPAAKPADFHRQVDMMLKGDRLELSGAHENHNRPSQRLLGAMEAARPSRTGDGPSENAGDGGGYQQEVARILRQRRLGNRM